MRRSTSEIIKPLGKKTDKKMISVDDWKTFDNIPLPTKQTLRPNTAVRTYVPVQRIPNPPKMINNPHSHRPERKNRQYSMNSY